MNSRLQKIEITNFKAFRKFDLNLEGRHLLVYGANGAGKSSLYWALYTFLQSARKPTAEVAKYFDPGSDERLLNIHEDPVSAPGRIALKLKNWSNAEEATYAISYTEHQTHNRSLILRGNLASDFITYRFFFGFSHFRNSEHFDLWPLFEKEILPFCVSTSGESPLEQWRKIESGMPNPHRLKGVSGGNAFERFAQATQVFTDLLPNIVDLIDAEAQRFYDSHFSEDDGIKIELKLRVTKNAECSGSTTNNFKFTRPVISFGIRVGGQDVKRPQSFLNEAKLTQLALSVRFAASLVNLHDSDVKLLVLDDLLVSLDMSNRMKVVEILLSETFDGYQKIILTHDMGLFREFRRALGNNHADWQCVRLEGKPSDPTVSCKSEKSDTQKAEEYLHGHNLDEAALCLRKACEDTAKRFIDHDEAIPTKDFLKLSEALRAARNKIHAGLNVELYEKIVRFTPEAHRRFLIASSDDDIDAESSLSEADKGRLKESRKNLRKMVSADHVEKLRKIKVIDDVLACTERVLNPAAHSGTPPLYKKEVQDALILIKNLESSLIP
jgi:energy-coupling factor transporter ATP-binding protein EcfA2